MSIALPKLDEDVISSSDREYQALLRSLRRRKGFGLIFLRCTPVGGLALIEKVRKDIPQKKVGILELQEPISNLIDLVGNIPDQEQLSILFIVGLEKSLVEYIRPGYGGAGDYYNLDTVPPILSHLNWQRENFRDRFRHLCFVFLLPRFAIKYIQRRAPDFFDWGSGVFDFPTESSNLDSAFFSLRSERTTEEDYLALTRKQRIEKLLEIQEMIDEPKQSSDQKAELYFEQGLIHTISSEFEEAIVSFDKALKIKPDNYEAWYNRGNMLVQLGRYEEAIASYDKALQIKSDHQKAWNNRGVVLLNLGRYEEAIVSFDKALHFKTDYHQAWDNRGVVLLNLGRYEEAISSYDKALLFKPNDYVAWFNRGVVLKQLGRYEEAINSYDKSLQFNSGNPFIYYHKACVYALQGNLELALPNLQKAIAIAPEKHREMAKTDTDFDRVRSDPRFQALIQQEQHHSPTTQTSLEELTITNS